MKLTELKLRWLIKQSLKEATEDTATRFVGTCGFCNKEQRVNNKSGKPVLVLHGYKRPGSGTTEGQCPGAYNTPFELSTITAELGLEFYSGIVNTTNNSLKRLESNPEEYVVTYHSMMQRKWISKTVKELVDDSFSRSATKTPQLRQSILNDVIDKTKKTLEGEKRQSESMLKEYRYKIDNWTPKQLHTFDEKKSKSDELKADRQVRLQTAKQEKYDVLKNKLLDRINSSFAKLKQQEEKYRNFEGQPLSDKSYKLADEMFDRRNNLVSTIVDNTYKLFDIVRNTNTQEEVFKDLGIDDILTHLGILSDGTYNRKFDRYENIPKGGNVWNPHWPGY